jgi:hypothetical protein
MKNLFFTLAVLGACAFLYSCADDEEKKDAKPAFTPPTEEAFQEMRDGFLSEITKDITFKAEEGISFTSDNGVTVNIYANCLYDENGAAVTGDVDLKYTELFDVGSMAIANKPLMGKDISGNTAPLVTGGEFNIQVLQGARKLDGCGINLQVPTSLTNANLPDGEMMTAWTINEDSADFVWETGGKEGFVGRDGQGQTGESVENSYYCWFPFGWTNIDWLYSLEGEKTQLRVKVPEGFDSKNCAVFAAYFSMPNTLAPFDVYVKEGEGAPYFTEHTGIAPVGYKMHVFFISLDAETRQVIYSLRTITVEQDKYIVFADEDLKTADLQTVIGYINEFVNP